MAEPDIQDRVRALVVEAAPIEVGQVSGETTLTGDLGYDSLSLLELMSLLEAEFGLPAVDGEFRDVRTLRDAADTVRRMLGGDPFAA
jgi:acyl carrier protein